MRELGLSITSTEGWYGSVKWKFWGKDKHKDKDNDNPLGHIEPLTLGRAMVAIVIDPENPINHWRHDLGGDIPRSYEDFFQISVHVYQLSIFMDLLERRFGQDIADNVQSHIVSVMATEKVAIERFFRAVWTGRAKPERDQFFSNDTACQVDSNVSKAFLDVISGTQTEKDAIYPILVNSLRLARFLADTTFSELVKKIDFRPETIVGCRRPEDTPIRWSEKCGCFERQLQRRHMNPLFPPKRRIVSRAEHLDASIKDWNDLKQLEADVDNLFSEIKKASEQKPSTVPYSDLLELRKPFERLIFRAAEIGTIANQQGEALRHLYKSVELALRDACPSEHKAELESLLAHSEQYWARWTNQFVRQRQRGDTPILREELVPSLLTEDVDTVRLFASILEEAIRKDTYDLAATLISEAENEGHTVAQAEQKLQALRSGE